MAQTFAEKLSRLLEHHEQLTRKPNHIDERWYNGVYDRYRDPVLTADHIPPIWRYDLNASTNPHLQERLGINCAFNAGAIEIDDTIYMIARVEGVDRKSFFAIAQSESGTDGFKFWEKPILLPQTDRPDTNVYDMRLTAHEDGFIYGVFCTERRDQTVGPEDQSSAEAQCGIVRTKDLLTWDRLPDIKTPSPQQRNVVLHPEFIDGQYAFYTRPQDGFISTGSGGGIGFTTCKDIANPVCGPEKIIDPKVYHTINEVKNGAGAPPIKTNKGWLHIAHGVRNTAAGLRYVLYVLLCDLNDPSKVIAKPGGFFIAPMFEERVGDVSNVAFCNGAVARKDGTVLIYYASSDTRMHVAVTSIDKLLDYTLNTPADPLFSHLCVEQRIDLIEKNLKLIDSSNDGVMKRAANGIVRNPTVK